MWWCSLLIDGSSACWKICYWVKPLKYETIVHTVEACLWKTIIWVMPSETGGYMKLSKRFPVVQVYGLCMGHASHVYVVICYEHSWWYKSWCIVRRTNCYSCCFVACPRDDIGWTVLFQCCELCCKWTYWFRSNHLEWGSVWGCMSGEFGKNVLYKLWVSWLAYFGLKSMSHSPWWRLPCWLTQVSHITLGFLSSPADIRGSACTVGALWLADKSVHCICGALWLADALHGGWHKLLNDDVAHGCIKGLMMCHIPFIPYLTVVV